MSQKVNVNRASEKELKGLKGFGDSAVKKIMLARESGTQINSMQELKAIAGIKSIYVETLEQQIEFPRSESLDIVTDVKDDKVTIGNPAVYEIVSDRLSFDLLVQNAEQFPHHKIKIDYSFTYFGGIYYASFGTTENRSIEQKLTQNQKFNLVAKGGRFDKSNFQITVSILNQNSEVIHSQIHLVPEVENPQVQIVLENLAELVEIEIVSNYKEAATNSRSQAVNMIDIPIELKITTKYFRNGLKTQKDVFNSADTTKKISVETTGIQELKIEVFHNSINVHSKIASLDEIAAKKVNTDLRRPELMANDVHTYEKVESGLDRWTDHVLMLSFDVYDLNSGNFVTRIEEEYGITESPEENKSYGVSEIKSIFFGVVKEVEFQVRSPRGEIIGKSISAYEDIENPYRIDVPPRRIGDVDNLSLFPDRPKKTTGRVIDILGRKKFDETQVIIYAKEYGNNEEVHPIVVTTTDENGYFVFETPQSAYAEAFAIVGIEERAEEERKIHINLEEDTIIRKIQEEVDDPDGNGKIVVWNEEIDNKDFFPSKIILVVDGDFKKDHEDCDCGECKELDFHRKRAILEEFSYYSVIRTTEPQIKGYTLLENGRMKVNSFVDLVVGFEPNKVNNLPKGMPTNYLELEVEKDILMKYINNRNGLTMDTLLKAINETKALELKERLRPKIEVRAKGRRILNADKPIDWDEDPTIYQATSIAHGHVLHFKQEWVSNGFSLGDLLYSLPLAPGQKKQIVTFDWERREAATGTEILDYQENLDNSLSRDRDVNEVVTGTIAQNMVGGSSAFTSSSSRGGGVAGGVAGFLGGFLIGVGGGYASSSGNSSSSSNAWQISSRNSAMQNMQQLTDRTRQVASSVRSQRSTVIQTASQGERFSVETESVANYNHCHAITIQYFEVLRHFKLEHRLSDVQECLFIPLQMSTFDPKKALRWREDLSKYLLNDPFSRKLELRRLVRGRRNPLLRGFDAIERRENLYENSDLPTGKYADTIINYIEGTLHLKFQLTRPDDVLDDDGEAISNNTYYIRFGLLGFGIKAKIDGIPRTSKANRDKYFHREVAPEIAQNFVQSMGFFAVLEDNAEVPIDIDATLLSTYRDNRTLSVSLRMIPGSAFDGIKRSDIRYIRIGTAIKDDSGSEVNISELLPENSRIIVQSGFMSYKTDYISSYLFRNSRINNDLTGQDHVTIYTPLNRLEERNPRKEDEELANSLLDHLNDNLEYYHCIIWRNMSPKRRFMFLDGCQVTDYSEIDQYPNGVIRSVASVVENRILGVEGNCIIMPVSPGFRLDPNIKGQKVDLFKLYQPTTPIEPVHVSLPTKGVFAESVMGKCNSCEKKEEDRFWRWEESPIPDSPTAIEPISTDSRRSEPLDTTPNEFANPMIQIQNAPAAPNLSGFGALSQLLANPNFENITGLDQNQKNALQALVKSYDTTKSFGDMAKSLASEALALSPKAADLKMKMDAIKKAKEHNQIDEDKAKDLTEKALNDSMNDSTITDEDVTNPFNKILALDKLQKDGVITEDQASKIKDTVLGAITGDSTKGKDSAIENFINKAADIEGSKLKASIDDGDFEISSGGPLIASADPNYIPLIDEPETIKSEIINANNGDTFLIDKELIFKGKGTPNRGKMFWTGGETQTSGVGLEYKTEFKSLGYKIISAKWQTVLGSESTKVIEIRILKESGIFWHSQFPQSKSTSDLIQPFRNNVEQFIQALEAGGATVDIESTLRPANRAFLMHYSYKIANGTLNPNQVPNRSDIHIEWEHRDTNGSVDLNKSRNKAQEMVTKYNIAYAPALNSMHIQGRAIDMDINWSGIITVKDADNNDISLNSADTSSNNLNPTLHAIGASYNVFKLVADEPHWSDNGS